MDFKKLVTAPVGAVSSLLGTKRGPTAEQEAIARMLADSNDAEKFINQPDTGFNLPGLDESLSEAGLKRKAELEARGEPFVPGEGDYTDSGPYGYLHKKQIHDALMEYQKELAANAPDIDYQGILRQRLTDIAKAPPEHRTNPLYLFAMAMGNQEQANELIQQHNKIESETNAKQNARWRELLDLKQQALEGSVKQALQMGEQKKIISGKWLDTLAQIEQDKAKLAGEMMKGKEKDAAAERRAQLRGEWALKAVKARSEAIATSIGIKTTSAEFRSLQSSATKLAAALIKNGTDPTDAYDQAEEWVHEQLNAVSTGGGGGNAAPTAPKSSNPLQERIKANRAKTGTQ